MRKLLILRNTPGGEKQEETVRESVFIREIRGCFLLWVLGKAGPSARTQVLGRDDSVGRT